MTQGIAFKAGARFAGPDGMGYVLKRDVHLGEAISADQLCAYGGAPEPKGGELMPQWLAAQITLAPDEAIRT